MLKETLKNISAVNIKSTIIDMVADIAPWLAPTTPAYFVYKNVSEKLGVPFPFNLFAAVAVETIGLASVHTVLELWEYNNYKRKNDNSAPLAIAVASMLFYVIIVITVNAVLDFTDSLYAKIFSQALFSLLAIDGALIVAIRAGQARRKAEIADDKAERKAERAEARLARSQPAGNMPERADNAPEEVPDVPEGWEHLAPLRGKFPTDWRKITDTHKRQLDPLSAAEIAFVTGLSDRAGREWRARLNANGYHEPA